MSEITDTTGQTARQEELPFALVDGQPLTVIPEDLYIPPDALEVILEAFEGPLDLLLYLIKRQNINIVDIPIAEITRQYMDYISLMETLRLELAAEYLVMAAMLAEIKSRMLLPRPIEEGDEEDPRAELIRRLQEYERIKKAAEDLDGLPRLEREIHLAQAGLPELERRLPLPDVTLQELLISLREVLQRSEAFSSHHIQREPLSVRERMTRVLEQLRNGGHVEFVSLFTVEEGRLGVVVSFLAILELVKESLVEIIQSEPFAPIYLKGAGSGLTVVSSDSEQ
jgi:segregation and condensation protein A